MPGLAPSHLPAGTRTATAARPRPIDLRSAIGNRAMGRVIQRESLANESEFERISNEVWRLLDEDPDTRALMDQALGELGDGDS